MDRSRFDRMTRTLATSQTRRGILGAIAAALVGAAPTAAMAHGHHPHQRRCVPQNVSCARRGAVCCDGLVCSTTRRRCVGNAGATCRTSLGCNEGLVCRNGRCEDGLVCRAFGETCVGGSCCETLTCDRETHDCLTDRGFDCKGNDDCANGLICRDDVCQRPGGHGDVCDEDADCGHSLLCDPIHDVCCSAPHGHCHHDHDCCADMTCDHGHCIAD